MTDAPQTSPIRRVVTRKADETVGARPERRSMLNQRAMRNTATAIEEREAAARHMEVKEDTFSRDDRGEVTLDDSQQDAVDMMLTQQYGCVTGNAGSGKTTAVKYALRKLEQQLRKIDWTHYRSVGQTPGEKRVPSIALCTWTNVAARNLAAKIDEKWTPHCMSVHSMLAFAPESMSSEPGENHSGRFSPRYHTGRKLPLDAIIIDEAGTIPRDLWHQILDACTPSTRIYFLGDLAQLPAIKGVSPMPFAIDKWPSVHLTTVYRQAEGGELIDSLNRIRRGLPPTHYAQTFRCAEKEKLPSSPSAARKQIGGYLSTLFKMGLWDPAQDMVITAENDATLGQNYWNSAFRFAFNPKQHNSAGDWINPPILIKTAIGVVNLSIGDKVMGRENSGRGALERRFVNGAIGTITAIARNPAYSGDFTGLGAQDAIISNEDEQLTAQSMFDFSQSAIQEAEEHFSGEIAAADDEDAKTRAASHLVTIVEQATGEEYVLSRSAEIASLQHAYAATCHKFQGSQARHVIVICHENMRFGLNREWVYTACSRAKEKVFLLHTERALEKSITKQQIIGRNADEKAEHLRRIYAKTPWGVPNLPEPRTL